VLKTNQLCPVSPLFSNYFRFRKPLLYPSELQGPMIQVYTERFSARLNDPASFWIFFCSSVIA
jgi:hypothetical protein